MKFFLNVCLLSFVVLIAHSTHAMDKLHKKDSNDRNKKSVSIKFSKRPTPPESPRKDSSQLDKLKVDPKIAQHFIWLFDPINLPIKICVIADVDTKYKCPCWQSLLQNLKEHNVQALIWFGEDDINSLDDDCEHAFPGIIKKLNITTEQIDLTEKKMATTEYFIKGFFEFMQSKNKEIVGVYGRSKNSTLYIILACWSIPTIVQNALERKDMVTISDKEYCFEQVLNSNLRHLFLDYIMELVYQRIIPEDCCLNDFISVAEQEMLKKRCLNYLNTGDVKILYSSTQ